MFIYKTPRDSKINDVIYKKKIKQRENDNVQELTKVYKVKDASSLSNSRVLTEESDKVTAWKPGRPTQKQGLKQWHLGKGQQAWNLELPVQLHADSDNYSTWAVSTYVDS